MKNFSNHRGSGEETKAGTMVVSTVAPSSSELRLESQIDVDLNLVWANGVCSLSLGSLIYKMQNGK